MIIAGILTHTLWDATSGEPTIELLGYGLPALLEGNFLSIISGAFVASAPVVYAVILPSLLVVGGYAEIRYGTRKILITMLIAHSATVFITILVLLLFSSISASWAQSLSDVRDIGISNALLGLAGALTAGFSALWRIRFRLLLVLSGLVFALYSALIWDITHFIAIIVGILLGPWLVGRRVILFHWRVTSSAIRTVSASLIAFGTLSIFIDVLSPANNPLFNDGEIGAETIKPVLLVSLLFAFSILVAYGLYRGRRNAWIIAIIIWSLSIIDDVSSELSLGTLFDIALASLAIIILLGYRSLFSVRSDRAINRHKWKWI